MGQRCSQNKRGMKQKVFEVVYISFDIKEYRMLGFLKFFYYGVIFFLSI